MEQNGSFERTLAGSVLLSGCWPCEQKSRKDVSAIAFGEPTISAYRTVFADGGFQGSTRAMKSDADIVRAQTKIFRNLATRFLVKIDPSENLRVVKSQGCQAFANATTRRFDAVHGLQFERPWSRFPPVGFVASQASGPSTIMVCERVAQNPVEPGIRFGRVIQLVYRPKNLQTEVLKGVFGVFGSVKAAAKIVQEFTSVFQQSVMYRIVAPTRRGLSQGRVHHRSPLGQPFMFKQGTIMDRASLGSGHAKAWRRGGRK